MPKGLPVTRNTGQTERSGELKSSSLCPHLPCQKDKDKQCLDNLFIKSSVSICSSFLLRSELEKRLQILMGKIKINSDEIETRIR